MIKNLLGVLITLWGLVSISQANCISFQAGTLCLGLSAIGSNTFQVSSSLSNLRATPVALSCDILTPDTILQHAGACNETIRYAWGGQRSIKVYARMENEMKTAEFLYNFTYGWSLIPTSSSSTGYYTGTYNTTWTYQSTGFNGIPNGFTLRQFNDVRYVYNFWPTFLTRVQSIYPNLINNSTRQARQQEFYRDTADIVFNRTPKTYNSFLSFYNGFVAFAQYTNLIK